MFISLLFSYFFPSNISDLCICVVLSEHSFLSDTDHAYRCCMSFIYQLPGAQCGGFPPMGQCVTALSIHACQAWESVGKKAPYCNALKPLIEQPIAIYLWMVAGGEGAQRNCSSDPTAPAQLVESMLRPKTEAVAHSRRQAPGLCRSWRCVQLVSVKPCFLSGISVLTESIWALGELPAYCLFTCLHTLTHVEFV